MKSVAVAAITVLFATQAFAVKVSFLRASGPAASPASAPAASPGGGPAGAPGLPVIDVDFEIMNYNYYDLARELEKEAPEADMHWGQKHEQNLTPDQMASVVVGEAEMKDTMLLDLGVGGPSTFDTCRSSHSKRPACVRDLLEDAVITAFEEMIHEELQALASSPAGGPSPSPAPGGSAPAAAPAPAAALLAIGGPASAPGGSPAPVPAASPAGSPGPAPAAPEPVTIHVTFSPGRVRNVALLQKSGSREEGRTVVTQVTINTHTGDGTDELPIIQALLNRTMKADENATVEGSTILQEHIAHALFDATGLMAVIDDIEIGTHEMEQWSIDVCAGHVKKVVKDFTMAYTRRMVPMAIYNECTNFMAKVSFSSDAHVTATDTQRCQAATVKFTNGWDYGKKDFNYREFCIDICELKYGRGMPKCHVTSGDKILKLGD